MLAALSVPPPVSDFPPPPTTPTAAQRQPHPHRDHLGPGALPAGQQRNLLGLRRRWQLVVAALPKRGQKVAAVALGSPLSSPGHPHVLPLRQDVPELRGTTRPRQRPLPRQNVPLPGSLPKRRVAAHPPLVGTAAVPAADAARPSDVHGADDASDGTHGPDEPDGTHEPDGAHEPDEPHEPDKSACESDESAVPPPAAVDVPEPAVDGPELAVDRSEPAAAASADAIDGLQPE